MEWRGYEEYGRGAVFPTVSYVFKCPRITSESLHCLRTGRDYDPLSPLQKFLWPAIHPQFITCNKQQCKQ